MNREDDRALWAILLLFITVSFWGVLAALIPGCWPIRVDPPTDEVCPTRPNCGQCTSDELCAWVASEDPADRRCWARREVGERGPQVRVLEHCPDSALGELP